MTRIAPAAIPKVILMDETSSIEDSAIDDEASRELHGSRLETDQVDAGRDLGTGFVTSVPGRRVIAGGARPGHEDAHLASAQVVDGERDGGGSRQVELHGR